MIANPQVWHIGLNEISIRIIIALILGGIIGLERERGKHPAGLRTHILVCVGAALITLTSIYGFSAFAYEPNVRMDPSRLSAQIVSGIGFLGAGTIMRTGIGVSGLTTAASLWVVAAIGLAVGTGFYYPAALATVLVLISLFLLNIVEKKLLKSGRTDEYAVTLAKSGDIEELMKFFAEEKMLIHSLKLHFLEPQQSIQIQFVIKNSSNKHKHKIASLIASPMGVINLEINRSSASL